METETESTQEVTQAEEIKDPKAVLEALERAKNDAKKYRERLEELEAKNNELAESIAALEGDEGIALWKGKAIALSAKAELAKSGIADPERVFGFMDASTLDLDDEGRVSGFEEAVADVKTKLPELFDNKRRVGGSVDAFASGDTAKEDPFRAAAKRAANRTQ